MVKYGKQFRKRQIGEWKDNYINYKLLKQKIKEKSSVIKKNNITDPLLTQVNAKVKVGSIDIGTDNFLDESNSSSRNSLTVLYDNPKGQHLKDFLELLDKEFKKVFVFFVSMEKELYKKINLHLYIKQSYHTFSIKEIFDEVTSIWYTIYLALSLLRFINDNMMAMKNIIKKLDKKYKDVFGCVSYKYLTEKLTNSNSDLDYLLHFKIIDETSAITESLTKTLKFIYKHEKKMPIGQIRFEDSEHNNNIINNKSSQGKGHGDELAVLPVEDLIPQIRTKFKEIKGYVIRIDESNLFRVQYRELMSYINDNDKITKNSPNTLDNDMYNPLLSCSLRNDSIMEKFISKYDQSINYHEMSLSKKNRINIIFCFMHTFLYHLIYSSLIPSCSSYLSTYNNQSQYICGYVFAMAPLASIISIVLCQVIIQKIQRKYKLYFALSYFLMFIGSMLYALNKEGSSMDYLMLLGRVIIGLGSMPTMPRIYITSYVSKYYLPKISYVYIIISAIALFFGPISCLGLSYFHFKVNDYIQFNEYTNIGWIGVLLSLILLILHLLFFSDPQSSSFSMLQIDTDDESYKLNLTYSNVPFLSQEEKRMINQIDTKLDQFNDNNNFTNINLIPNEIRQIVEREQRGLHYFSKNISIVFSLLFVSRLLCEGIILRPLNPGRIGIATIGQNNYYYFICVVYLIQIVPYVFVHQLSYHSRRFRWSLIIALGVGITLCILLCFILNEEKAYYIIVALLSLLATILEISVSSLISLILPPKWNCLKFNSSFLIPFVINAGKAAGPLLLSVVSNLELHYYILLGFSSIVFLSIIILLLIYTDFRVKAIAKILRNQMTSKLMMED